MKFLIKCTTEGCTYGDRTNEHLNKLKDAGFNIFSKRIFPGNFMEHLIEVNSLEEIMKLQDILEEEIILYRSYKGNKPMIEIYDDYRE